MVKSSIKKVIARQIYDSRSNPTIEVDIILNNGVIGRGLIPSGASTGLYEALELRDGDLSYMDGKGVQKVLRNIEEIIAPKLIGMNALNQVEIDQMLIDLDGTENKSKLGANAILGCSLAAVYAAANYERVPLYRYLGGSKARTIPIPMIQIIGGGAHAINTTDIQDYLVIPLSANSFSKGYEMVVNVYHEAQKIFSKLGKPLSVADEGGLWPSGFINNEEGLVLLTESIKAAGYIPGQDLGIALDVASSEFYNKERNIYKFKLENKEFSSTEFINLLEGWVNKYPIISIEDGCSELDWEGSILLTKKLGKRIQLIGDDLFTTNINRIKSGFQKNIYNSVLIKMNQIGTITETIDAINYTKSIGYSPVISARSGETEDVTIVHLAIASNAGQLKVGSVSRSERTAKWNELIRIEQSLGNEGEYLSKNIFSKWI